VKSWKREKRKGRTETMITIANFDEACKAISTDEGGELFSDITGMDTDVLVAIAKGDVNVRELAKAALAGRGIVANGGGYSAAWAGFENAKKFWRNF
jgi:hypothetical protein